MESVEGSTDRWGGGPAVGFLSGRPSGHRPGQGTGFEPLGDLHFDGWIQVLDFLHLLVHLYAAATAAFLGQPKLAWRRYQRMLPAAWAG